MHNHSPRRRRRHAIYLLLAILVSLLIPVAPALADGATDAADPPRDDVWEGVVRAVLEEGETVVMDLPQHRQLLRIELKTGPQRGREVQVEHVAYALTDLQRYSEGQRVLVVRTVGASGEEFYVSGPVRRGQLSWMTLIFVAAVVATGRRRGACSLLGLALSFAVVFVYILPRLAAGANPIAVAVTGSALTVPITFYLSHGVSRKTTVAVIGTAITLVVTALIARLFVESAHLTGYASEEASFLLVAGVGEVDVKGLLLAGMIVAMLGVLDDVTVSQAAVVQQLKAANPLMGFRELYRRAMAVGQDHIASMVNTLVLVYAGAALPLMLLLTHGNQPFWQLVSYEPISEEIVRMLVSSLGLVGAVPLTTVLASIAMIDASPSAHASASGER